jgi:hypothetical protein
MPTDFTNRDVNLPYWPGQAAAGMAKTTTPPVEVGMDTGGMLDTVWRGRNAIGVPKGVNIGPNAMGQPKYPSQPTSP